MPVLASNGPEPWSNGFFNGRVSELFVKPFPKSRWLGVGAVLVIEVLQNSRHFLLDINDHDAGRYLVGNRHEGAIQLAGDFQILADRSFGRPRQRPAQLKNQYDEQNRS